MAEKDGRLYGRGTSDMKGGIAAMCKPPWAVPPGKEPMKGSLKLLFVADEECSNLGTLSYLKTHGGSGYAIIGEPTRLEVAVAHRGVSRDYIDIKGLPGMPLPAGGGCRDEGMQGSSGRK
ncbi:MAG: M20/M25/M40 family metallo-hydrolase [Enterocloster clostridioformis]